MNAFRVTSFLAFTFEEVFGPPIGTGDSGLMAVEKKPLIPLDLLFRWLLQFESRAACVEDAKEAPKVL